jgi:phosphatidylserine/phosphatidylglycerophosphate/cardiolipin synthase-like enzyme
MGTLRSRDAVALRASELMEWIGPEALAQHLDDFLSDVPAGIIAERIGRPDLVEPIAHLAEAAHAWGVESTRAFLDGYVQGVLQWPRAAELVWTGPSDHRVPVRSMWEALMGVIVVARHELWLSTYSAKPYQPLIDLLTDSRRRGVEVSIAVETLAGAGSAISGSEPATAFAGIDGAKLYGWPVEDRPQDAKLHAKLALADEAMLLVTSANFTGSALERNIEAGVLVTGGPAPKRAAEHLKAMVRSGILKRIA